MQRILNHTHWIELLVINLANIGVLTWMHYIPTMITSLVGLTIIILNVIKIYKELKK
jgi:hypothetical protein